MCNDWFKFPIVEFRSGKIPGRVVVLSDGASCCNVVGKQMKSSRSIKLKGTVIGGSEAPLHKLAMPDVTNALYGFYKSKREMLSWVMKDINSTS